MKKKLLIVDDDPHQLKLMRFYLADEDYEIFTETSARQALRLMLNKSIDIVLTDFQMPDMNGSTFARKISEEYELDVPIIILSADRLIIEKKDPELAKRVHILVKPFTSQELKELLKQINDK